MRLVILAAGKGQRIFKSIGKNKCLLNVNGKTLIKKIIHDAKKNDIKKITVVTGFRQNLIKKNLKKENIEYLHNNYYKKKEMLHSLVLALKKYRSEDIFVTYSDIYFDSKIFTKIKSKVKSKNIVLIVNKKWKSVWKKRKKNIIDDCETLDYNSSFILKEIGKKITNVKKVKGQFMGCVFIPKNRINNFINKYEKIEKKNNKFHLSNFLNFLINKKEIIKCIPSYQRWYEFDDIDDYKNFFKT